MSDVSEFMDRVAVRMESIKSLNQGLEQYIARNTPLSALAGPQYAHIETLHVISKEVSEGLAELWNVVIMLDEEIRKSKVSTR